MSIKNSIGRFFERAIQRSDALGALFFGDVCVNEAGFTIWGYLLWTAQVPPHPAGNNAWLPPRGPGFKLTLYFDGRLLEDFSARRFPTKKSAIKAARLRVAQYILFGNLTFPKPPTKTVGKYPLE